MGQSLTSIGSQVNLRQGHLLELISSKSTFVISPTFKKTTIVLSFKIFFCRISRKKKNLKGFIFLTVESEIPRHQIIAFS